MEYEWAVGRTCVDAPALAATLDSGTRVAFFGRRSWWLAEATRRVGAELVAFGEREPPGRAPHARFLGLDAHGQPPADDDTFDLVVLDHVLERTAEPLAVARGAARIARPGGWVWIQALSERSLVSAGSDDPQSVSSQCFYDDPSNLRPYTPAGVYRLALSLRLYPWAIQRVAAPQGASVRSVWQKPVEVSGLPPLRAAAFAGLDGGVRGAFEHLWADAPG